MNGQKLFIPLIAFALIATFFFSMEMRLQEGEYDPPAVSAALVGKSLPEFAKLDPLTAKLVAHHDMVGEIALINVWATWCPSCYGEHPYLMELAERGVIIYRVDYKDEDAAAKKWLAATGNPYRINVFDSDGSLGLDFGVTGAPETYPIDRQGYIRTGYQGPVSEKVWREKFAPLIS